MTPSDLEKQLPQSPANSFDSPSDPAHLLKAIRQIEEGKVVVKTLPELEAMEN